MLLIRTVYLRRCLLLIVALLVATIHSVPAIAISQNQFKTENDILFYEKNDASQTPCKPGTVSSLTGKNNEEKAFRYLMVKGLTAEQAAGVIGNLVIESGVIPDNQQNGVEFPGGGWGIAQWTNESGAKPGEGRRDRLVTAVKKANLPYTNEATPANQIEELLLFEFNYMWEEAIDRGDITKLKKETTVSGSAQSWLDNFERAGVPATQERITEGERVLKLYGSGGAITSGTSCSPSVASGNFSYYSQYDPEWANEPYGTSGKTIESSGCGPSSMAMIISTLSDNSVTPKTVATWGAKYYIEGQGSSHALFAAAAKKWGLKSKVLGANEQAVKDTLNKGGFVVAGGSGADPYTTSGHVIVIRAVTPEGKYLVGNPLPEPADQGKASIDVAKNTSWLETEYTWAQLSTNTSGMYGITK